MLATDTNWSAGANKFIMGHGAILVVVIQMLQLIVPVM